MTDSTKGSVYTYAVQIETAYWGSGWHAHLAGQYTPWTPVAMPTEAQALGVLRQKLEAEGITLLPIESVIPAKS